jgi:hypothetical protein
MGSSSSKSIRFFGTYLILLGLKHRSAISKTESARILYEDFCACFTSLPQRFGNARSMIIVLTYFSLS